MIGGSPITSRVRLAGASLVLLGGWAVTCSCDGLRPLPPVPAPSGVAVAAGGAVASTEASATIGSPVPSCSFVAPRLARAASEPVPVRIIGGSVVPDHEARWMVSLQRNGRHFCGGTLISERDVLTAAHCMVYDRFDTMIGDHDLLGGNGERYEIAAGSMLVHPDYDDRNGDHDVALLRLPVRVEQPFVLMAADEPLSGLATTYGWGVTESGELSTQLLSTQAPIVARDKCWQHYPGLPASLLCSDMLGAGSCQGDSGGPLFVAGLQAGIVSRGIGCADGHEGLYANVALDRAAIMACMREPIP